MEAISTAITDNQMQLQPSQCRETCSQKEATMLSLTIQKLGDVTLFQCAGRITAGDGDILRIAVRTLSRVRTIVIDLAEVSAIDAAGLGMLVSLRTWATATGTELKLMNLTPRVEEVLQLTNLRAAFEICSVREMMDLLCRASRVPQYAVAAVAAEA
jgi:anti-sigma B factor antagonist